MTSYRSDQAAQGSPRSSYHPRPAEDPNLSRARSSTYARDAAEPVNATIAARASSSRPGAVAVPLRDHSALLGSVDRALPGQCAAGNATVQGGGPSSAATEEPFRGIGTHFGGSQ
ncbi:hypothetical protein F5X99DRAFT_303341 [Biscogniauxia marginata]|nr:hypothetical protein F5X99DRAFT_303341 [Biscogniauxia marginata]